MSAGSGVAGDTTGDPEAVAGMGDWFTRSCYLSILAVSLNPAAASLKPLRH
ncbi:hypothetical protein [Paenarthrobacter sp.]|uniref:hypothetical protein n=1 Tax=Paenarthrobacter sp. TaxID=1931993 RepID=UPI00281141AE|nr:hypothetical protein [Paenarthrobacter sp.]